MLALLPARLPGSYNLCCSAALSICHFALAITCTQKKCCFVWRISPRGQEHKHMSGLPMLYSLSLSLSYTLHILPSGAAVPVETTPGLVKFCWVGRLTTTSLVPIGYSRKLPENWEWGAFHSCWLIRKTGEWAELTSAFYESASVAGICVRRSSCWWQMQKDFVFCTSTTALKCNVIAEGNLTVPPSRHICMLPWFIKLVFYHLFNIKKVVRSVVRSAYELDPFHWFRAVSNQKSIGSGKTNCNFNNDYDNIKTKFSNPLPFLAELCLLYKPWHKTMWYD